MTINTIQIGIAKWRKLERENLAVYAGAYAKAVALELEANVATNTSEFWFKRMTQSRQLLAMSDSELFKNYRSQIERLANWR